MSLDSHTHIGGNLLPGETTNRGKALRLRLMSSKCQIIFTYNKAFYLLNSLIEKTLFSTFTYKNLFVERVNSRNMDQIYSNLLLSLLQCFNNLTFFYLSIEALADLLMKKHCFYSYIKKEKKATVFSYHRIWYILSIKIHLTWQKNHQFGVLLFLKQFFLKHFLYLQSLHHLVSILSKLKKSALKTPAILHPVPF